MADKNGNPESELNQNSPPENGMVDSSSKYSSSDQAGTSVCELSLTPDILHRSFNITLKLLSPAASSGPFCRICHEGDTQEDLVSLCKCTGSVGLVHLTCMERWLNTRRIGHDKCEICNYSFETIRSPKSITEWYRSDQGAMGNRHNILGDMACFSLITPCAAVSTFLCFEGAKRHIMWNNSLEAGCLMALAMFLITIYIVWNILTIRYHLKSYFIWRSLNQNVRLVRYRRKSTDVGNVAVDPRNIRVNGNSSTEQVLPFSIPSTQSEDVNAQTSNVCLTDT